MTRRTIFTLLALLIVLAALPASAAAQTTGRPHLNFVPVCYSHAERRLYLVIQPLLEYYPDGYTPITLSVREWRLNPDFVLGDPTSYAWTYVAVIRTGIVVPASGVGTYVPLGQAGLDTWFSWYLDDHEISGADHMLYYARALPCPSGQSAPPPPAADSLTECAPMRLDVARRPDLDGAAYEVIDPAGALILRNYAGPNGDLTFLLRSSTAPDQPVDYTFRLVWNAEPIMTVRVTPTVPGQAPACAFLAGYAIPLEPR